jgi:hypothetical protein
VSFTGTVPPGSLWTVWLWVNGNPTSLLL